MILPHVGLVLLLGLYTVCGASVFHMLEMPHETKVLILTSLTKNDVIILRSELKH